MQSRAQTDKAVKAAVRHILEDHAQVDSNKKKSVFDAPEANFKRPLADNFCQTEVDEHGLWDRTDGWILPLSGTTEARIRWRRAIAFAKCPSCRGVPKYVAHSALLLRKLQKGDIMMSEEELYKDRRATWTIPEEIVHFLCNLPRSVQAERTKSVLWMVGRVLTILHAKQVAEKYDSSMGYGAQKLSDFIIEFSLLRSPGRADAELEVYRIINTLKSIHQKHPLLQTFSRFVGLLDGLSKSDYNAAAAVTEAAVPMKARKGSSPKKRAESPKKRADSSRNPTPAGKQKSGGSAAAAAVFKERIIMARASVDDAQGGCKGDGKEHDSLEAEQTTDTPVYTGILRAPQQTQQQQQQPSYLEELKISDSSLSHLMLSAYMYIRSCLLFPYTGVYEDKIRAVKANSTILRNLEFKLKKDEQWLIEVPEHVCLSDNFHFWVPLDRCVMSE